jgi:hypothetical protein
VTVHSHTLALGVVAALTIFADARAAEADVTVFDSPKLGGINVNLYGWVQPRFTDPETDDRPGVNYDPTPGFTLERARLGTYALLGPWARVQVEVDFSQTDARPIDAYVILTPLHNPTASINFQLGQFRVPISRQNLLPSVGYQLPDVAYFVAPNFLLDRELGGAMFAELWGGRAKLTVGMFDSNDPGAGQSTNSDAYFMGAARLEISPLGRPPNFEGDLRSLADQHHPIVTIAASAMRDHYVAKGFDRRYLGADLGAWWEGASIYGEVFYHADLPLAGGSDVASRVRQLGWNIQAGYFPPLPWVREHIELAARVEYFDPAMDVTQPANDSGARDLNQSNPTWGYRGYILGANYFLRHDHFLKAQVSYEIRNETKPCLAGQVEPNCTGFIKSNVFVAQITAGF